MIKSESSEANTVHCGFIPLVDCAVLVVAHELGFDKEQNISLKLHKEVSWANIRDRVNLGHYDCAHMLAGMPIAGTLGIGHIKEEIIAPFSLGRGGNAITLSQNIFSEMCEIDETLAKAGGMKSAQTLSQVLKKRAEKEEKPVTLGMVYPFSCHNYDLRYWLASAGINPDTDVRLVAIPPSLIAESLEAGHVQGFCVGEPWNSLAVERGYGRIIATKNELWSHAPEKVLGVRKAWADQESEKLYSLIRALDHAARWLGDKDNLNKAASLLSRPEYLNIPENLILRALKGELLLEQSGDTKFYDNFLEFNKDFANFPWHSHAIWLMTQMIRWKQLPSDTAVAEVAENVFRPDIYREALSGSSIELPDNDMQINDLSIQQTFFNEKIFDPYNVTGYMASMNSHSA